MKLANLFVDGVTKNYPLPDREGTLKVLEDINLHIKEGEFVSILGPSGCGKSTLLNIVAGFEPADSGSVVCDGKPVNKPSPERAVVFQSPVLFPWLNVQDNISYGLKRRGDNKTDIDEISYRYLQAVGLENFENYYPFHLSGGMQQRVALARALALNPRVLLMDEPFAALDAQTRLSMQRLLLNLWGEQKPTVVFVTHDIEEALFMSDRVFIMSKRPGRIVEEIKVPFERPRMMTLISSKDFVMLKHRILCKLLT
jgi:NitT/TauT family transport system ATP-binding protein